MQTKRYTGINAGSLKYDLLTALTVTGLHGSPGLQATMIRLTALITARYNWTQDELSVGQRDIARMWNLNERTVKREIKRCLDAKILICKRQGVRGRVGAYRLNLSEIYRLSQPHWDAVGPDFVERMQESDPRQQAQPETPKVVQVNFAPVPVDEPLPEDNTETTDHSPRGRWRQVTRRLKELQPQLWTSWFSKLQFLSGEGRVICLKAQNRFSSQYILTHLDQMLHEAIEAEFGPGFRLQILHEG